MRLLIPVLLVLAGCLEPVAEPDSPVIDDFPMPQPSGTIIDWELTDCRYANVFIPIGADALEPLMPEGFALARSSGLRVVEGVNDAYLGYEAFECAAGTLLDGSTAPMVHGGYFTSVVPPEDLAVANATGHYLRLLNVVPDEGRRAVWAGLGFPVVDGSVSYTIEDPAAVVSLSMAGDGTVTYAVAGTAGTPGRGDWIAEYMVSDQATAVWETNYTVASIVSGQAAIAFPQGSLGARLLGLDVVVAPAITGVWDFHDGHVRWWLTPSSA